MQDEPAQSTPIPPRRYLLTGATSGIGLGAATLLRRRGHQLELPARREMPDVQGTTWHSCDLSLMNDVDALLSHIKDPVDGVLHVAGVLHPTFQPGPGGIDITWWTNLLGPARLTLGLLPTMAPESRVVWISGEAHRKAPLSPRDLGRAKGARAAIQVATAKLAWTLALARRHPELRVASFCPGLVRSNLSRNLPWIARGPVRLWMSRGADPIDAARAPVALLDDPWAGDVYTVRGAARQPADHVNESLQEAVWDWVAHQIG
ncbi:MAG: NAD(P)-dependent dehydrogenase (short-subunit alcohol dehydrogenase family) [Kiritimatiellia bacterium]|jgi:NAD(P)-dependent dehydrogenase (short-subunit alcohol dehydrogenase family)